ncbi:MAG: hypothetical protein EOM24_30950 [Chloroflexia bacterium]|nr:hypothetical protein [Chloroflexia bacterium]
MRHTTSRAAGLAAASQLTTLCDAASSCSPDAILLRYPVLVTPEGPVAPGADNKRVGVLIFETTHPAQFGIIEILGIRASLQDPLDETLLLTTAPALEAYINALTSGLYCNPFGYVLTKCIAALFQYRQN